MNPLIVSPSWSSLRGGNRRPAHTLMLPTRASLRTKAIALLVSTGAAGRKRARLQPCKTMPSRIGRKSVVVRVITSPFGIVRNSAYTCLCRIRHRQVSMSEARRVELTTAIRSARALVAIDAKASVPARTRADRRGQRPGAGGSRCVRGWDRASVPSSRRQEAV